jgi:hypothetical protein
MFKRWFLKLTKKIAKEIEQDAKNKIMRELFRTIDIAGKTGIIKRFNDLNNDGEISLGVKVYISGESYVHVEVGQVLIVGEPIFNKILNLDGYSKFLADLKQ